MDEKARGSEKNTNTHTTTSFKKVKIQISFFAQIAYINGRDV